MKKLVFLIITLISTLTFAGTTPRGTNVSLDYDNEGYTDSEIQNEINKYLALNYDLDDIISDPTDEYNCHGYAWEMTEGGTDAWPVAPSLTNPCVLTERKVGAGGYEDYYDDGSYNDVDSDYATVIKYHVDHSAIKDPQAPPPGDPPSPYYFSKWFFGPLVLHLLEDCPYYVGSDPLPRYFAKAQDIPFEHDALSVAKSAAKTSQTIYVYKTDNITGENYSYNSGFATLAVNKTNLFEQRSLVIYDSVAIDLGIGGSIQANSVSYKPSLDVSYNSGIPTGLETRNRQPRGVVVFDEHVTFSPNIVKYDNTDTVGFFGSVYGALNDTLSAGDSVYVNSSNAPLGDGNITDLSKITLATGASIFARKGFKPTRLSFHGIPCGIN